MPTPRVLILRAPGTNCDRETAFAFETAGAETELVHINRLREQPDLAGRSQILCIPGGFSYGDDIAAGRILASRIRSYLADTLAQFKAAEKLVLGICNGFQVLVQTGMLVSDISETSSSATLAGNDSAKFEDRWVELNVVGNRCVMLRGIERMYLPIAHAEGKFVTAGNGTLERLDRNEQLVLRYCAGADTGLDGPIAYPANPNGSQANVAGMCDDSGRVLGLMPHPERFIERTQHPRWTREALSDAGDGLAVFGNSVTFFSNLLPVMHDPNWGFSVGANQRLAKRYPLGALPGFYSWNDR